MIGGKISQLQTCSKELQKRASKTFVVNVMVEPSAPFLYNISSPSLQSHAFFPILYDICVRDPGSISMSGYGSTFNIFDDFSFFYAFVVFVHSFLGGVSEIRSSIPRNVIVIPNKYFSISDFGFPTANNIWDRWEYMGSRIESFRKALSDCHVMCAPSLTSSRWTTASSVPVITLRCVSNVRGFRSWRLEKPHVCIVQSVTSIE